MFSMNDYPPTVAELPNDKCCVLTMASIASVQCSGVTSSLELSTTKVHNIP